ncbi:MAG: hypothetical protein RQ760_22335 [Sedimentisphaerales bacterium]|nr:hypothetical protein [Sedimentisphaerales bacterium]
MQNKSIVWIALGLIISGLLAVSMYRMKSAPTAISDKDLVFGSVSLPETINQFAADGENGVVNIEPDNGIGQLPVGEYTTRLWRAEREDDQGDTWALTGQSFGDQSLFKVNDTDQTKLDIGEPIIATVNARKSGSIYSFNQIIKGRLDEYIEMTRNGARPQAPKLNIKNSDGTYDRTFSFEYG